MKRTIIDLKLSPKSCQDLKKKLTLYKKKLEGFNSHYMEECLKWIKERSITILNNDDTFLPSEKSDIREKITIEPDISDSKKMVLKYYSDIVAWVEFGTGIIGQKEPHPLANEGIVYNYAVGKYSGNAENNFTWYWRNVKYDNKKHTTQGYVGKQFIYSAMKDFINTKMAVKIYQMEYEKIENEVFGT